MRTQFGGFVALVAWAGFAGICTADTAADCRKLVLWYTQPANQWTETLPIGNGRLGAIVFGKVADDHRI